ncbi:hypothetical protein EES39_24165 [Streptomyces sp. ADI92-24]|nr:hypothetical protein EDD95_3526 [Streptomyces sp. CEV 2-1]RPK40703.1 hypothetical protein EES39_24165 [Streptomyces sp. ADI92-24]
MENQLTHEASAFINFGDHRFQGSRTHGFRWVDIKHLRLPQEFVRDRELLAALIGQPPSGRPEMAGGQGVLPAGVRNSRSSEHPGPAGSSRASTPHEERAVAFGSAAGERGLDVADSLQCSQTGCQVRVEGFGAGEFEDVARTLVGPVVVAAKATSPWVASCFPTSASRAGSTSSQQIASTVRP